MVRKVGEATVFEQESDARRFFAALPLWSVLSPGRSAPRREGGRVRFPRVSAPVRHESEGQIQGQMVSAARRHLKKQ